MWYKYLMLVVISFFAFNLRVDALLCDKEHVSQLKELANQVEVNYEYIDNSDTNEEEFTVNNYFVSVKLNFDELYLENNSNYYNYIDNNGEISFYTNSGTHKLNIYSKRCEGTKLRTINLTLPRFNVYSYKSECKQLENYNLDVCDPWYQGYLDEVSFYKKINKYLDNDNIESKENIFNKIINFASDYYLYALGLILVIILVLVTRNIYRKRSVLE